MGSSGTSGRGLAGTEAVARAHLASKVKFDASAGPLETRARLATSVGYVPLSMTGAELLCEVFSQRYERGRVSQLFLLPMQIPRRQIRCQRQLSIIKTSRRVTISA